MPSIKIIFENGDEHVVELSDSPLKNKILKALKHLQHVKLPFKLYDNTFLQTCDTAKEQLLTWATEVGVDIDVDDLKKQEYLNALHEIYEKNYNGDPAWLQYHEAIHITEQFLSADTVPHNRLSLDYREKAGPTNSPYEEHELQDFTLTIDPGDCVVVFNELGKTPYQYWSTGEPDNIVRLCQLAKPLLRFNFSISMHFDYVDKNNLLNLDKFLIWFEQYKTEWCNHWNLKDWTKEQIIGVIKIGHCKSWLQVADLLKSGVEPVYLRLID